MLIMFLSKYPIQIKRVTERLELSTLRMWLCDASPTGSSLPHTWKHLSILVRFGVVLGSCNSSF